MLHQYIKWPGLLRAKNQANLHLNWWQSIRRVMYPKVFQCDNGSEFKGEVTKLLKNTMLRPGGQQRSISTPIQPSLRLLTKS